MNKKNKLLRNTIAAYHTADDGDWIENTVRCNNSKHADIIIIPGGVDVDTAYYNEPRGKYTQTPYPSRDRLEEHAIKYAWANGQYCIGICRGSQFQTILAGGKLIQHVTNHSGYHEVETIDNGPIHTNSIHHQMCYPWNLPEDDYIVLAYTLGNSTTYLDGWNNETEFPEIAFENGLIKEPEIIWYPKLKSLAIQFHP